MKIIELIARIETKPIHLPKIGHWNLTVFFLQMPASIPFGWTI